MSRASIVCVYHGFLFLCFFSCSDTWPQSMYEAGCSNMLGGIECGKSQLVKGSAFGLVMVLRGGKKQSSRTRNPSRLESFMSVSDDVRTTIRHMLANAGEEAEEAGSEANSKPTTRMVQQRIVECREELER